MSDTVVSEAKAFDEAELASCELCEARIPEESIVSCGDVSMCPDCLAAEREVFEACDHSWEASDCEGEAGYVCLNCGGFVDAQTAIERFGLAAS